MNKNKRAKRAKKKAKENRIWRAEDRKIKEPKFLEKSDGEGGWIKVSNPHWGERDI